MIESDCSGHECSIVCAPGSCQCPPCSCGLRRARQAKLDEARREREECIEVRGWVLPRRRRRKPEPLPLFTDDPDPYDPGGPHA